MVRGLERRAIFRDDADRAAFVSRVAALAEAMAWTVYAWALLPDHAHLLVRTGTRSLSRNMRSLLTGYAGAFNRRHHRAGHLFQNRYKSIVVEEEPYLLELVRYIHLNPLRAGVVRDAAGLTRYPWSGHSALLGRVSRSWQSTADVLGQFAGRPAQARAAYAAFVHAGIPTGRRPELQGGGLIRSAGGWAAVQALRRGREAYLGDERVLGSSDFVEALRRATPAVPSPSRGPSLDRVCARVCAQLGIAPSHLAAGGRHAAVSQAREGIAYLWVEVLGHPGRPLALVLGVRPQSVYRAVARGRDRANEWRALLDKC
jgi:REP element-mobilizing transposase RayT